MIKVLFFASYREALGISNIEIATPNTSMSLAQLKQLLIAEHGATWQAILEAPNRVQAINQTVADDESIVADSDEVAFFPPVTGG